MSTSKSDGTDWDVLLGPPGAYNGRCYHLPACRYSPDPNGLNRKTVEQAEAWADPCVVCLGGPDG